MVHKSFDASFIQRSSGTEFFVLSFDISTNDANQGEDKEMIAATRAITLGYVTLIDIT
jgi:hypothetical protein